LYLKPVSQNALKDTADANAALEEPESRGEFDASAQQGTDLYNSASSTPFSPEAHRGAVARESVLAVDDADQGSVLSSS